MTRFSRCLGFLRDLDSHAVAHIEGQQISHATECPRCGRLVERAAERIRVLVRTGAVSAPGELSEPSFFEGIVDRAAAEARARIAPLIDSALNADPTTDILSLELTPVALPKARAEHLREELLLRLRKEQTVLHPVTGSRRRTVLRVASAVAAVIFVSVALAMLGRDQDSAGGTHHTPHVVFTERDKPLDGTLLPGYLLEKLGG